MLTPIKMRHTPTGITARTINRAKGRNVVGTGAWTILVIFFWIITMSWYVFSKRRRAISEPTMVLRSVGINQGILEALGKLG